MLKAHVSRSALVVAVSLCASMAFAQTMPKGARQISEAYEGWTLTCGADKAIAGGATTCSVNHTEPLADQARSSMMIALKPLADGGLKGTLVVPFGLDFTKGVTAELDGKPFASALQFRTCLPAGCFLPIDWPTPSNKQLRAGQKLRLIGTSVDGKQISVTIAVKGLGDAFDRATALSQSK